MEELRLRPDFAIVGPPKTGTTALYSWLRDHPEIWLPDVKEIHFFDLNRDRGLGWYREQFLPAGGRKAGEATTTYLAHPSAIEELASLNPDIKLIATVRDPVDRAWSHYNYGVARGWFTEPFEAMVIRELAALVEGDSVFNGLINSSRFGHHLERAARHVASTNLLVLSDRELAAASAEAFMRVCRFLGISEDETPSNLGSRENETRHVRYPRLFHALLRLRLDRALPDAGKERLGLFISEPGYPALDEALRSALDHAFEPDQRRLSRFLKNLPQPSGTPTEPS